MFEAFKEKKKQKELQQQKAAEAAQVAETKEKIQLHAKGGEKIRSELNKINLEKYIQHAEQGEIPISAATLRQFQTVIQQIDQILDFDPLSDVDTEEIDNSLTEMVSLFGTAVENGNEATATQILKGIGEGVKFIRYPYTYSSEEEKLEKHRKRQREIDKLLVLASCQTYIDTTELQIHQLDMAIEEQEQEQKEADQVVSKMEAEDPALEDKATEVDMGERKNSPEIQQYVNAVNKALEAGNHVARSKMLREIKVERVQTVTESVHRINLMAFGSTELFGNIAFERFAKLHEEFIDDVKKADAEMAHLQESNRKVDMTLETMFQNAIDDTSISNIMEYHMERRRLQEEEKEKEQLRQAQTDTEEQVLEESRREMEILQ